MKVIDLLNKIAKGELEENTKFKYRDIEYIFHEDWDGIWDTETGNRELFKNVYINRLNDPIKIIEEEKEIEELKIEQVENGTGNFYIRNEYGTKCCLTKHSKIMADKINELVREVRKLKKEGK